MVNHVLSMRKHTWEGDNLTFSQYAEGLDQIHDRELPDPSSHSVEIKVLIEEAKVACTAGMLLCLDREQGLIYV